MKPAEALWRNHLMSLGGFIEAQRLLNKLSERQLANLADLSEPT